MSLGTSPYNPLRLIYSPQRLPPQAARLLHGAVRSELMCRTAVSSVCLPADSEITLQQARVVGRRCRRDRAYRMQRTAPGCFRRNSMRRRRQYRSFEIPFVVAMCRTGTRFAHDSTNHRAYALKSRFCRGLRGSRRCRARLESVRRRSPSHGPRSGTGTGSDRRTVANGLRVCRVSLNCPVLH